MVIARMMFTLGVCFAFGVFPAAGAAQQSTFSLEVTSVNGKPLKKPMGKITAAPGDVLGLKIFVRDSSPDGQELRPRYDAVGQHGSIAVIERFIRTM